MKKAQGESEGYEAAGLRMAALARARGDVETTELSRPAAEIIQFPLWPEPERAAPNAFLRSALFGIVKKGSRTWVKDEVLAAWPGAAIRYKGEQLGQYDESVWLQLVHLHRTQGVAPGGSLRIYTRAFLRDLGCGYGEHSRKALYESLKRLRANAVALEGELGKHVGGLLVEATENAAHDHWTVVIDPKIAKLFAPGHYSRLDWQTRLALKTDLAKWLQGYIVTHQATPGQPHRIGLKRLYELSGSGCELKRFRFNLKKAMSDLAAARVILSWSITPGDALEFVRPPQRKSLSPKP